MSAGRGGVPLGVARANIPGMSRGVDLSVIRDKRDHQHFWVNTAEFIVTDAQVKALAEYRDRARKWSSEHGEDEPFNEPSVQMDFTNVNLFSLDGPGCIKCKMHWESEVNGYGELCPVSDASWEKAFGKKIPRVG